MEYKKHCNTSAKISVIIAGILLAVFSSITISAEKNYRLLPGDTMQISVWKEPDLQREVLVRPDGKISFPLAGHLVAAGRTLEELELAIIEKLSKYIPAPVVTVAVSKLAGYKIYVLGKVEKPGEYIVTENNVLQALSLAGGLTRFASESDIQILRGSGEAQQAIEFNYDEVAEGENLKQNIILQSGDVLLVR